MKKKIINGILLVAVLVAASSAFVSCKDNDADSQTELLGKIANLENQIKNLQQQAGPQGPAGKDGVDGKDGVNGKDGKDGVDGKDGKDGVDGKDGKDGVDGKDGKDGATYDDTEIQNKLSALQDALDKLKENLPNGGTAYDDSAIKEQLENIQKQLDEIAEKINTLTNGEIYSISADYVANPLFGFNIPFNVKSNILLACFGEAKRDIYFPNPLTGEDEPIFEQGQKITFENGNAGRVYVTVNPSNVDFSGKILNLTNTAGEIAPVKLSALKESNAVLSFATRGENAFYEASAEITDLEKLELTWTPEDVEEAKESVKDVLKNRDKYEMLNIAELITNIFANNKMPAYRLQATWGDNNHTYSPATIAAVAVRPLAYDFDLSEVADYEPGNTTALEQFEEYVVETGTKTESTQNKIWRFLNKFNKQADKFLSNINWAVQPTLLFGEGNTILHPNVTDTRYATTFKEGEITLIPTSWTAELLAPAVKKFVGVIKVNGLEDPEELAKVNTGNLGKIIDGSITEIPMTVEAGKTYQIQYSAMDFSGRVVNLFYTIRGRK